MDDIRHGNNGRWMQRFYCMHIFRELQRLVRIYDNQCRIAQLFEFQLQLSAANGHSLCGTVREKSRLAFFEKAKRINTRQSYKAVKQAVTGR